MLWTQVSRASMPGTGPGGATQGRDVDVPGTLVQDTDVQDHPDAAVRSEKTVASSERVPLTH